METDAKPPGAETTNARLESLMAGVIDRAEKNPINDYKTLKKYAVISTPRSGSSLLCATLEENDLGQPKEWFNDRYVGTYIRLKNMEKFDLKAYLRDIIAGTLSPDTNVFGLNFHIEQYLNWQKRGLDLFSLGFDKLYYIERSSLPRQAYSYAKAVQSGFWSKEAEQEAGHKEPLQIDVETGTFIECLRELYKHKTLFQEKFSSQTNRVFVYEDLAKTGFESCVLGVFQDLSIPGPETIKEQSKLEKQSGDFDEKQRAVILEELGLKEAK